MGRIPKFSLMDMSTEGRAKHREKGHMVNRSVLNYISAGMKY